MFPGIEPTEEAMFAQFSGDLPDEVVDERLVEVRALPGVEYAYKKPAAQPALGDTGTPG